jgi:ribosomal protein S18 acetylase RimI-like enzyme
VIKLIEDSNSKEEITRLILNELPDWFGIPEAIDEYATNNRKYPLWTYLDNQKPVAFISLKATSQHTAEIYVIGVNSNYMGKGIGTSLFEVFKSYALNHGFSFIQVKTVKEGVYPHYDKTNHFYRTLGFKELEAFPELWDEKNICQIYILAL